MRGKVFPTAFFFATIILATVCIFGGIHTGAWNAKVEICVQSGFNDYVHVDAADFCVLGEGVDAVYVPLLVTMPKGNN